MALTGKGRQALTLAIDNYIEGEWFSAKELSDKCGEKIVAATLTAVCNNGYMEKQAGSPVKYSLIKDAAELLKLEPEQIKKGANNANLRKADAVKNDEFYTRYEDVEVELIKYKKYFANKSILLPCDDHGMNRDCFWRFFVNNFDAFGLKKLIAVHYSDGPNNPLGEAYKIWIEEDKNKDGFIDEGDAQLEYLNGNGDFRSEECKELFKEADIIITNPPFSLFGELLELILKYQKQFLLIGSDNKITDKNIFPLIKNEKVWFGYNAVHNFIQPDGTFKKFGNIHWYTNLPNKKFENTLISTKTYNQHDYPKYDDVDAINVDKVKDLPKDYQGWMGVPISILYNKDFSTRQFEIIGILHTPVVNMAEYNYGMPYINGVAKYARILIKRK